MSLRPANANVRRAWFTTCSMLAAFALLASTAPAQDAPAGDQQAQQDQPQDPANRRPTRTKGRGPQRARPQPAEPQPQQEAPQPAGQPGEEEMTDEQLQQEVQELLKNQPPGQEMDPAVQKRIEELLQRKARNAKSRAGQPPEQAQLGQIQPIGQPNAQTQPAPNEPAQPENQPVQPDPNQAEPGAQPGQAARPNPREAARQRAEERRKQREQQQAQQGLQPQPQDPSMQQQGIPPLPPPAQSFQPQPVDTPPSGPTTQINIPRDETEKVPAEERTYSFSIKNGTYEQLIEGFARQTGLAVQGEIPQGGTVNFVTTQEMSFKEALSKVQMQLFNYRPHEPYWMLHEDETLKVIRVTDLYRIIPKDRVFPSLEAYRAAGLTEDEIVLMFYTPKSGSIGDLIIARNFLPDYVRITPLTDQNGVAIFALVKDIERFLDFVALVGAGSGGNNDPRVMERIPMANIPASDALNKLNQLMGPMDVGGQRVVRPPMTGQPTGLEGVSEPAVSIIADDEQNVLIVRAVQKTVDEIKRLLPYIDVSPSAESPPPVILPLKHTTADAIIPVIQQMLAANPSAVKAVEAAPMPPGRRGGRSGRTSPAATSGGSMSVATESVLLIPHPSGSALIVTANTEADITAVQRLVEMVDVPVIVEWVHIPIKNADPESVREGVETILGNSGPSQPGQPGGFQIFVDPTGSGIWFSGPEKELDRVRAIVEKLDVTTGAVSLHRIRIEFQTPSFVANMLREMEGAEAAAAAAPTAQPAATPQDKPPLRGGSRRGLQRSTAPAAAGKFTPDDPSGVLYVICNEQDWTRYQEIIEQLDQPIDPGAPPFMRVPLEHVDAETAVEKLSNMIGANPDALSSEIRLVAANRAILVMGASERELENLKIFLQEVDLPAAIEQRTFIIQHADPGEIKTLIEAFVADSHESEARPRRGRPPRATQPAGEGAPPQPGVTTAEPMMVSNEMTIVQLGNKLIVRAAPAKLDEIGALVEEFDLPGGGTEIRVYQDFPPSADIENIANTVESVVTGAPPGVRRGAAIPQPGGGTAPPGPKFIPQPNSGRLIVVASPTDFPRIEELLRVLRYEIKDEQFVVEFIPVQFVDPVDLVDQIQPVLEIKVRGLLRTGELAEPAIALEDPAAGGQPVAAARRRVGLGGGGADKTSDKYHLSPDSRNKRIVVAAPKRVVEEVRTLIAQFDLEGGKSEIVFRTVELQNTAPAEMIQAVKEMMGKPQASRVNRVKRATGQAGAPGISAAPAAPAGGETATGESLTIVEAPGGGAIVLHGVLADVEQATEWIHKLDNMASTGRVIKAYKIDYADVEMLFGMIVNVVDSAPAAPAASGAQRAPARQLPRGKAGEEEPADEEEPEFTTTKTHNSGDLYIHADLIGNTLLVATTQAKINQIENVLEQFKTDPEITDVAEAPAEVPMRVFDLRFAEADDADYEFDKVIDALWKGKEKPRAKAAPFGNALLVEYPDESRFPEIEKYIKDYVDVRDEEKLEFKKRGIPAPQGISAKQLAEYIKNNMPDIDVEVIDVSKKTETYGIEQVLPNGTTPEEPNPGTPNTGNGKGAPCVLPASLENLASSLLLTLPAQSEEPPPEEEEEGEPAEEEPAPEQEPEPAQPDPARRSDLQDRLIRERLNQNPPAVVPINQPLPQPAQTEAKADEQAEKRESTIDESRFYEGQKLTVKFDEKTGTVTVEGPKGPVDQIDDLVTDLKEEIEELTLPPDIRIVRVRHIDVYTAQDILEEMFNATRQQREQMLQMQRQQQMVQRQQQQMQQQQMRQAGQRGGPEDEKQRQQQQQQQQQPQMEVPQLPPTSVRVYPNPRDRTLILRADTSQYPEIFKLLATIDQPKPFDSFMRVFPLKKLNAKEVETMLRDMLNLGQGGAPSRRSTRMGQGGAEFGGGPEPATGPGSSLPESILQETRGGTNLLGIDPEDIKLFASEPSNSIMAMAPPEALDYIEKIIADLESGDIPNRVTRFYQLQHAAAQDVVDYLGTHFGDASKASRGPRAEGAPAATTAAGGGAANAPTFIAYSQLNQITVQATEPQISEIEDIIKRLDVETGETWRDVRVVHVDAAAAADILSQMFGEGTGGAGRAPGGAAAGGGRAKFIGEPGGNIILFSAPQNMHQQILDNVAKLDKESEKQDQIRVVELQFAVPSTVAEAIDKAYQDTGGTRRGGAGAPAGKAFTVTAHDASGRLFIKASDTLFAELESLAKSLDRPGEMPEFRIYPLQHANAKAVHAQMTKLMTEFIGRLGKAGGGITEPFSVQVDETANALIVLGGPTVFGFLEENLRKIDTPAAGTGKVVSATIPLEFNDAGEVAGNLQRMYQGRPLPEGVTPPQIEANRQNNTLIIRATEDQIAEMRTTVIEPLEAAGPKSQGGLAPVETIKLTYADPGSVADAIGRLFRSDGRNPRDVVTATPEFGANALLVAAYPHMMQRVKDLIAQIDIEDAVDDGVHVVELRYADPESVARTLNEIYVQAAKQRAGQQGTQLSVSAVPGSQAIVVRASDTEFARMTSTIKELDIEGVGIGEEVRMITLSYADAGEVHTALQEYLRKAQGGRDQLAGDVRLTAMPQANAVMVAAKKEEVDRLEQIIHNMDVAGEKGTVPQIIPLKYANAGMMVASLDQIYSKPGPGQQGRNYAPPIIAADEGSNALIVRAVAADMASIEQMVARMDTEDKKDQTPYKIIPVPAGQNVEDLAERVETSINETAAERARGLKGATVPKLTVIPDRRTSSITLAGSASLFADAEAMIKTFAEMGPAGGIDTRMIRVTNISTEEVEALIQQLTQPPGGGEGRSRRSSQRQPGSNTGGSSSGGSRRERQGAGRP